MKKILSIICIAILFYLLLFPSKVMPEVTNALIIWYQNILPALLPFTFISYIFIESGVYLLFNQLFYPFIRLLLPISRNGVFPLVAGFLFGFPLGSKVTADLVRKQALSPCEGTLLCAICNQISPAYIIGIVSYQVFDQAFPAICTLLFTWLPSLLLGRYFYKKMLPTKDQHSFSTNLHNSKKKTSRFQFEFKIIDAAILNGFETMLKLCGYIVIFALFSGFLDNFSNGNDFVHTLLTGLTELTNGIARIPVLSSSIELKYAMCMLFLSFGGLSCMAQTLSMIKGSGISFLFYIKFKCISTAATMILTGCYLLIF